MKSFYLSGILLLTFIGGLVFSTPSSAASTPVSTAQAVTRPTKLELEQAILKVRGIGNYEHYFPTASSPALDSSVKFYQEYNYLRTLVATARQLLANYDTAPTDDLLMIIAAAQDAEIACNLKFGITRQKLAEAEAKAQSQTQPASPTPATSPATVNTNHSSAQAASSQSTKPTTQTATSSQPQSTLSVTSAPAPTSAEIPAAPAETIVASAPLPEESAESENETTTSPSTTNPSAQLLAHSSTAAVATCFIGAVVYSERRTYRPGRSRK